MTLEQQEQESRGPLVEYECIECGRRITRDRQPSSTYCGGCQSQNTLWKPVPVIRDYINIYPGRGGNTGVNLTDLVNEPPHYLHRPLPLTQIIHSLEPIPYYLATAIKYIYRHDKKGDAIGDLEKARKCIELEIEHIKEKGDE